MSDRLRAPYACGARSLVILAVFGCTLALGACGGGSNPSTAALPSSTGPQVRFVDGAPELEALINGVPTGIGTAYLQVDGQTVTTLFAYGTLTPFLPMPAGTHSLRALDTLGYAVGPLKTTALTAGNRYTLVLVGAYPNYRVLTFVEPTSTGGAQLSLYEASPMLPHADFGSFRAASHAQFKKLGSATFPNVTSVTLGKSVADLGGYVGRGSAPIARGALTLQQVDSFDLRNRLPFHQATRLSLFLFDPISGSSSGPVFGSLDL